MPPNPSDLERPAPNEPVRIQPPVPNFARGSRPADRDEEAEPPGVDEAARAAEMERERRRLRKDPERRRAGDRPTYDVNRWVHQRANQPRGGRWQTHGHTMRGR
jgi:hypothetical protein